MENKKGGPTIQWRKLFDIPGISGPPTEASKRHNTEQETNIRWMEFVQNPLTAHIPNVRFTFFPKK